MAPLARARGCARERVEFSAPQTPTEFFRASASQSVTTSRTTRFRRLGRPNPIQTMNSSPTYAPRSLGLRWLSRAGIALAALLGTTLSAQPTGSVTGVVTDNASNGYL